MTLRRERLLSRAAAAVALMLAPMLVLAAMPAAAQDRSPEPRIKKLEAEVRALQRKVFPGGDGTYFQPEITAPATSAPTTGQPATSAVTDMLARMDALEAQLARLTAQTEQNANRIALIEARLPAPDNVSSETVPSETGPAAGPPAPVAPGAAAQPLANPSGGAIRPARPAPDSAAPAAPRPSSQRVAAVRAVEKPQTADPGDDEYSYGYRLWDAKLYPEAEQQLKIYLEKYPKHPRVSFARNLLGRAYFDDNDPREAAKWFLQNYQADKTGARAPDSLLYLARSMKQLGDTNRACVALGEFAQSFAAEAAGRLKADYDSTRSGLKCS